MNHITKEPKTTASVYYCRGFAKSNRGDFVGAINDYNKAIELDPKYTEAYYVRGNARNSIKDYAGAIVDYNQAILLDPKDGESHLNRGIAKFYLGDRPGALDDINKSRALGIFEAYDVLKKIQRGQM